VNEMTDHPSQEHWKRVWQRAQDNMPCKLTQTGCRAKTTGQVATLMRVLDLDMTKTNKKNIYYKDYPIVSNGRKHGIPPKDAETRRKLEVCAGPYGRFLAYQKLQRLFPEIKYEKPR
jgi:hypothetical protein